MEVQSNPNASFGIRIASPSQKLSIAPISLSTKLKPSSLPSISLYTWNPCQIPARLSGFSPGIFASFSFDPPEPASPSVSKRRRRWPIKARLKSASSSEIDMVRNKQGVFTPKEKKVVVLWDLDNKPPRGPPYEAAIELRRVAERLGRVVEISAYANRHAFIHLPHWVVQERRERRNLDFMERKGEVIPIDPYICGVCGRKCKTNLDLKKHFKQLHERERQKKVNRMRSLKGKKRQKFKERYVSGNDKYNEAARSLLTPRVGYGLEAELRRAGVQVRTVEDKPQAADWAVKRQIQHSMTRGIDWLVLVSDDKDFSDMLRKAREADLGTLVVSDRDRALGRHADLWLPWIGVQNGEIGEADLVPRRLEEESEGGGDGFFSLSSDEDETTVGSDGFGRFNVSAFSENEWAEDELSELGV